MQCAPTLKKAAPGIYSCYVPADGHHDAPRLAVGDVVRVTGRVFDRRDRSRSMDVESVEVVADPTHEPAHMLEALARSDGMYRRAPDMPKECGVIEELDEGAVTEAGRADMRPAPAASFRETGARSKVGGPVSYTHLTLPTNREV